MYRYMYICICIYVFVYIYIYTYYCQTNQTGGYNHAPQAAPLPKPGLASDSCDPYSCQSELDKEGHMTRRGLCRAVASELALSVKSLAHTCTILPSLLIKALLSFFF